MRGEFVSSRTVTLFMILTLVPVGAGVGTGIDALIQVRKIIYERAGGTSPPSFGVSPLLSPGVRGVRVSVSF